MQQARSTLVLAVLVLLAAGPAAAQRPAGRTVVVNTEAGGITTTILAVDRARRTVTLTGPRGNRVTLPVGPEVANFDRVRADDAVAVSFVFRQVITVVPGNAPPPRPGSFDGDTAEFPSRVVTVDYRRRALRLQGPGGGSFRVAIAPETRNLEVLHKGDRVIYQETTVLTAFAGGPMPGEAKVGLLQCELSPSIGLILGSHQNLACRFMPDNGGAAERYTGAIDRIGLDIGITAGGQLAWAVYSPTTGLAAGALAGTYVGASGDITVGIGIGAKMLVGGSDRTTALQPLSLEGRFGANLALGVASLSLQAAR